MPGCHDHSLPDHLPPVDLDRISAVSVLSGEHQVILQVLDVLAALAARAGSGALLADDARDALDVLRTFADRCHHGKEEDILFPALEAQVPGFGPTQVMRAEHVDGRALIRAMAEAVERNDADAFARAAQGYVTLLRDHIAKEDGILFRIAQAMLTPAQDAAILDAYRRIEHDDLGDGTHQRMLATADRLAQRHGVRCASADAQTWALLTAVCDCATPPAAPIDAAWRVQLAAAQPLAAKVARVHGLRHPDMATLVEAVAALAASRDDDHDAHAALGRRLDELTDGFRPWSGACATVHQLFHGLRGVAAALPATHSVA